VIFQQWNFPSKTQAMSWSCAQSICSWITTKRHSLQTDFPAKQRQSASVLYRHGITEIRHRILEERPVRLIRSTEHANWNLVSCPGLVPLFWMIRSRFWWQRTVGWPRERKECRICTSSAMAGISAWH
jgi:Alpha-glucosidases, family 31 of glycosyl hydrolases